MEKKLSALFFVFVLALSLAGCALNFGSWHYEPCEINWETKTIPVEFTFSFNGSPSDDVTAKFNMDGKSYPLPLEKESDFTATMDLPLCKDYSVEYVTITQNGHGKDFPNGLEISLCFDFFTRAMLSPGWVLGQCWYREGHRQSGVSPAVFILTARRPL